MVNVYQRKVHSSVCTRNWHAPMLVAIVTTNNAWIPVWASTTHVCPFSASCNASISGQNARVPAAKSVLHIINWLSTTASQSIIFACHYLAKRNASKGGLNALVKRVIASIRYAKINALINSITAVLFSAKTAVLIWEINVLYPVIQDAPQKTNFVWTTVPSNTTIALQPSVRQPALVIGSIARISAL